ncbi:MAG: 4Fe-4S binding protein [Actinobacteria bacterium]|nr:4Fe-4S binding protein [Actinomycetota bacterium]
MSATFVPRRSPRSARQIRWSRHLVQTAIVAWVAWTIWSKAVAAPGAASPEAFCPFGGFETAFTWITTGATVAHVHTANLVLAGIVVVLALVGRGFFCGWLCPLGSIQEAIRGMARAVTDRAPWMRRTGRAIRANAPWWPRVDHILRYGRYVVLVWAIGGAAVTGVMVFREFDPWNALLSIAEFEISTAFVVLIAVLGLSVFVDRPFCRYACPLGAVQGLIGKASPLAIQRNADACLGCTICNNACPMNIEVNQVTRVTDTNCIGCLECVAACPSQNAIAVTVTFPSRLPVHTSDFDTKEGVLL